MKEKAEATPPIRREKDLRTRDKKRGCGWPQFIIYVIRVKMANADVDLYLDGVANFAVSAVGLAINAFAIGMLCRQKTSSLFVKLMISLVTYDFVYVLLSALCYSLPRLSTPFKGKVKGHNYLYKGGHLSLNTIPFRIKHPVHNIRM